MIWFESFSASAATCTRSAPRHDQDQKTLTDSAHKDESTSPRQAEPGRAREETEWRGAGRHRARTPF